MKNLIVVLGLFLSVAAYSQTKEAAEIDNTIYASVDKMAEFPGGIGAFRNEFAKNVSTKKIKQKGVFRTEVTFVVEKDGTISEVKAVGQNADFNQAALAAMKKITTKWNPGKKDDVPVRYRFRFPAALNVD